MVRVKRVKPKAPKESAPEPQPTGRVVTAVMNAASVRGNQSLATMIEEYVAAAIQQAVAVEKIPPHSPTVTERMDEARMKAREDYAAMVAGQGSA